jgi:DNA-binding MarR family transcriptional regulator
MTMSNSQLPVQPRRPGPPQELLSSSSFLLKKVGHAAKERLGAGSEELGLGPYDHAILALLHEEPRETQATIADALGFDRSHLVGVLDELEERELIERQRDPNDRRRHAVSLTSEGKRQLVKLRKLVKGIEEAALEPLEPRSRDLLHKALLTLTAHNDPRFQRV